MTVLVPVAAAELVTTRPDEGVFRDGVERLVTANPPRARIDEPAPW